MWPKTKSVIIPNRNLMASRELTTIRHRISSKRITEPSKNKRADSILPLRRIPDYHVPASGFFIYATPHYKSPLPENYRRQTIDAGNFELVSD